MNHLFPHIRFRLLTAFILAFGLLSGVSAQANELGHCVFGTVLSDEPLSEDEVSVGLMGQKGIYAQENEWVFLDTSGSYSFCGLVDGKYKILLSPSSKTQILFEMPFEIQGADIDQTLTMSMKKGAVDFKLENRELYSSILAYTKTREEILSVPLNPQANSWGVYEPGITMPAMNRTDLWVLGAMPQTVGYRYNDYAFRQPVAGGPLAPFDIGGLNRLVIQPGGLSAEYDHGGGALIQWQQRRLPNKTELQLSLHVQPEETNFISPNAQRQWGQSSAALALALPIVQEKLWLHLNMHYLNTAVTNLTGFGQRARTENFFLDAAATWHVNASNALRASVFWQPQNDSLTTSVVGGELTNVTLGTTLGTQLALETQLARAVTWHNQVQYMWHTQEVEPERCPEMGCSAISQMHDSQTLQELEGWQQQNSWNSIHAESSLKIVVPVKQQRWPVKIGALLRRTEANQNAQLPRTLTLYDGDEVQERMTSPQGAATQAAQLHFGWYVQPQMRLNSYLRFFPGLRWDRLNMAVANSEPTVLEGLSPRLGVKVYPTGNTDLELRGGFFQYRDVGVLNLLTQQFMPNDLSVERWNSATESWAPMSGRAGDRVRLSLADDLILPTLNEGLLGFGQRFENGLRWSIDAVYRQMDNIYAFYETNLQWDETYNAVTGSSDGTLDSHLLLGTYQNTYQTYWGFQFRLAGLERSTSMWRLNYSLGNYTGSLADYFDDREQKFVNHQLVDRALPMDVRHQLNLQYGWFLRRGLHLSQVWNFQTGAPLVYQDDGTLLRSADQFVLQTRLLWRPPVKTASRLNFYVDVFNVFNSNSLHMLDLLNQDRSEVVLDTFTDPLRIQFGWRYGF